MRIFSKEKTKISFIHFLLLLRREPAKVRLTFKPPPKNAVGIERSPSEAFSVGTYGWTAEDFTRVDEVR